MNLSQNVDIATGLKLPSVGTDYDEVPYPIATFPLTHPDRSATIGTLFHLEVADPNACRVLELGCASGSNLIPMAVEMPGSQFLGVDLSRVQIADGRKRIEALGLGNIRLEKWDILDLADSHKEEVGLFDYIITHGIYSWVPAEVRNAILRISSEFLSPNGIASISYNTKPGWCMRGMVRDMMLYHTRKTVAPRDRAIGARKLVAFLAEHTDDKKAYGQFLRQEAKEMEAWDDAYLLHDALEATNESFYFHEFMSDATTHGLQYLGDADLPTMFPSNLPPAAQKELLAAKFDHLKMEQYMDFIRGRSFRQTLLVHSGRQVNRALETSDVKHFYISALATNETPDVDLLTNAAGQYKSLEGRLLSAELPIVKAGMSVLCDQSPLAFGFDTLFAEALQVLARAWEEKQGTRYEPSELEIQKLRAQFSDALFFGFAQGLIETSISPSRFTLETDGLLTASPLARLEAPLGSKVTNMRHQHGVLDPYSLIVLPLLDGTRNKATVATEIVRLLDLGQIDLVKDGRSLREHPDRAQLIAEEMDSMLRKLARVGLLV